MRTRFVWERGSLIIDDPVFLKPFASAIEGLAWVFSRQEPKPVDGGSVCCWSGRMGRFASR